MHVQLELSPNTKNDPRLDWLPLGYRVLLRVLRLKSQAYYVC
jgi:hypothetical protein